jgi:hypothetical protein
MSLCQSVSQSIPLRSPCVRLSGLRKTVGFDIFAYLPLGMTSPHLTSVITSQDCRSHSSPFPSLLPLPLLLVVSHSGCGCHSPPSRCPSESTSRGVKIFIQRALKNK